MQRTAQSDAALFPGNITSKNPTTIDDYNSTIAIGFSRHRISANVVNAVNLNLRSRGVHWFQEKRKNKQG